MSHTIEMKTIAITTQVDDVVLKGQLNYWAKDFAVILLEPFKACCGAHLQYAVPAKYVIEPSLNPTCKEINILERAPGIFQSLYKKEDMSCKPK